MKTLIDTRRITLHLLLLIFILAIIFIAACSSNPPSIRYEKLIAGSVLKSGGFAFNLPKTVLILRDEKDEIILEAVPVESSDMRFAVYSDDPWFRETVLSWTKHANTDLLKSIGTEVIDNRVETIEAIGTGISAAISTMSYAKGTFDIDLLFGPDEDRKEKQEKYVALPLPIAIDIDEYLKKYKEGENLLGSVSDGRNIVKFTLTFLPPSYGSFKKDDYWPAIEGKRQHDFFIPACRTATLTIRNENTKVTDKPLTVTVADPRYWQRVRLPAKGKIELHSLCNADVVANAPEGETDAQVVSKAISQAKSILQEWKKVKETPASK